ncbi:MAG: leucine-rich repeat domain-containing protein [Muribaculaceae bacterium]|nr:leucine-rich repeat domain-containing protein [Muribaculaceae bacterium]
MKQRKAKIYLLLLMAILFALPAAAQEFRIDPSVRIGHSELKQGSTAGNSKIVRGTLSRTPRKANALDDFEYEGLWYTVVDSIAHTCITRNGVLEWNAEGTQATADPGNECSGELVIPSTINNNGQEYTVVGIGDLGFTFNDVTTLSLPSTIKYIGEYAFRFNEAMTSVDLSKCDGLERLEQYTFSQCNILQTVLLPDGLKSIGEGVFWQDTSLKGIQFPASLAEIGLGAFSESGLQSVDLSRCKGLEILDELVFYICPALEKVLLSDVLKSIGDRAFQQSGLQSVDLSLCTNIESINNYVFAQCPNLNSIILPEGLKSMGEGAFWQDTSLKEIHFPASLAEIGFAAFSETGLEAVDLTDNSHLTIIGPGGFGNCPELKSIKLPASLESIGDGAFNSPLIEEVEYAAETPVNANSSCFAEQVYGSAILKMPNAMLFDIEHISPWNLFSYVIAKDTDLSGSGWYVSGYFQGWSNFDPDYEFVPTSKPGVYKIELADIYGEFLIGKGHPGDHVGDDWLRSNGSNVEVGVPYYYVNWIAPEGVDHLYLDGHVKNATITIDLISGTLLVEGDYHPFTVGDKLYIIGSPTGGWNPNVGIEMRQEDDYNYSWTGELAGDQYFGFTSTLSPSWDICNSNRYAPSEDQTVVILDTPMPMYSAHDHPSFNSNAWYIAERGVYSMSVDLEREVFTVAKDGTLPAKEPQVGDEFEYEGLWYKVTDVENRTCATTNNSQVYVGDIIIPEVVPYENTEFTVTAIGDHSYYYSWELTTAKLPETVKVIGSSAFYECFGMTDISLPSSLRQIEGGAFERCRSLQSIEIPDSVFSIAWQAFYQCEALTSVKLPVGLKNLETKAFNDCLNITTVRYDAVTPLGAGEDIFSPETYESATLEMPNATLADIAATTPWNQFKHVVAKDGTLPAKEPQVGDEFEYEGLSYRITDVDLRSCEVIAIPFGEKYSGDVVIPAVALIYGNEYTVTGIGYNSFRDCKELTSVLFPESLITIGNGAFWGCTSLESVVLPGSLTSIDMFGFAECANLVSVTLPASLTSIGHNAFDHCTAIESIALPASLTTTGEYVFQGCTSLVNVDFSEGLTLIGVAAFNGCTNLASVDFPSTLTKIQSHAFNDCASLTSVVFPEAVNDIELCAFQRCTNLESIVLPAALTGLDRDSFGGCVNLSSITYLADKPIETVENSFSNEVYESATLTMPNATLADIAAVEPWNLFKNVVAKDGTLPAEEPQYPVTFERADPADDATVSSLSSIETWWNVGDMGEGLVINMNVDVILRDASSGETVRIGYVNLDWDDFSHYTVVLSSAVTTPGTYELVIPAGVLIDENEVGVSEAVTLRYTVENSTPGPQPQLVTFNRAEPADGATVTSLSTVNTYWNVGNLVMAGDFSKNPYLLDAASGEKVTDAMIDFDWNDFSLFYVSLNDAVTTPGSYELVIPEGAITDDNGAVSEAVTLHYTVKAAEPQVGDRFEYRGVWYAITGTGKCAVVANPDSYYSGDVTIADIASKGDWGYEVTSIAEGAFMGCTELTSVRVPFALEYIGNMAFAACTSLTEIDLPSALTRIEENAFSECSGLTTLRIPNSVTYLGQNSFGGCTGLMSLTLPASIVTMEDAFAACPNIESVHYAAEKPVESGSDDFDERVYPTATLTMPNALLEDIQNTMPWMLFQHIVAKDGVLPPAEPDPVTFSHAEPADGTSITAFYDVMTYWNTEGRKIHSIENEDYYAHLLNADGETVKATPLRGYDEEKGMFVMDFSGEYAPGEYSILIPAGVLADENDVQVSEAVTLHYYLEPPVIVPAVGDRFEYEGLWYTVTEGYMTCETLAGSAETPGNEVSGDVTVPATVSYLGYDMTVTTVGDYGFSSNAGLLSVSLPATVESVGESAFAGCERFTSLVWKAHRQLDAEVTAAVGNPNLLVYVNSVQFAPQGMNRNVVVMNSDSGDPECENLVLEPGRAFRPALPFTSMHSSMTKEFTQTTPIEGCAGWETIVLPFDASSVRVSDARGELTPFRLVTDILRQYPYWLYEAYSAGEWLEAASIKAGVPYIISMPNNEEYEARYNISGPVTFSNDSPVRITPETAAPYAVTWPSGREFRSLWLPLAAAESAGALGLNVGIADLRDDNGELLDPGSAFHAGVTPQPLEAYVAGAGGARAMRISFPHSGIPMVGGDASLRVENADGVLTIYSGKDRLVEIFRADGVKVAGCEVKAGEPYRVESLEKGIYIVAGRKHVL